jgi:hypothetical protein
MRTPILVFILAITALTGISTFASAVLSIPAVQGSGCIPACCIGLYTSSLLATSVQPNCGGGGGGGSPPDFAISTNPSYFTFPAGRTGSCSSNYLIYCAKVDVSLTSLYGFSGTVSLSASYTPCSDCSMLQISIPSSVTLTSSGSVTVQMTVVPSPALPMIYAIWIVGSSGSISHQATPVEVGVYASCPGDAGSSFSSANWGGYQYYQCNTPPWDGGTPHSEITPVLRAHAQWTVTTPTSPSSGFCDSKHCDVAPWIGLSNGREGGSGIVQGGTDSGYECFWTGCQWYYSAWWEFFPAGSHQCSNFASPGDTIVADIAASMNNFFNSPTQYTISITDTTNGHTCGTSYHTFGQENCGTVIDPRDCSDMGIPYYADFITETPQFIDIPSPGLARLPKFTQFSFSQCRLEAFQAGWASNAYQCNSNPIVPYQNLLESCTGTSPCDCPSLTNCVQNILIGAVDSNDTFTVTWKDSTGTGSY